MFPNWKTNGKCDVLCAIYKTHKVFNKYFEMEYAWWETSGKYYVHIWWIPQLEKVMETISIKGVF